MKRFGKLIIISCLLLIIVGCKNIFLVENEDIEYLSGKYYVEINVKKYGKIELELNADKAPITVTNFMELVRSGAYNNNKFHRVAKDFVIQGGELADAKQIKGEFLANGIDNDLSHERGVISMARGGDQTSGYDTASSQFFIVVKDSTYLDNYYSAFGKVTKGMNVVDKINKKVTNTDSDGTVLKESDMPVIEYIKEIEK
jgi:peptidyl-prolyl cis-trans isomerase B (cyclophilin B)